VAATNDKIKLNLSTHLLTHSGKLKFLRLSQNVHIDRATHGLASASKWRRGLKQLGWDIEEKQQFFWQSCKIDTRRFWVSKLYSAQKATKIGDFQPQNVYFGRTLLQQEQN